MDNKVNIFIDCCADIDDSLIINTLISLFINYDNINIIGISISYGKSWFDVNPHKIQQILNAFQINKQIDIFKGVNHSLYLENKLGSLSHYVSRLNYPSITGDILKSKFEELKNGKNVFVSLTNLTCFSTLIMQCPNLRLFIDKFICLAGAFNEDIDKEINIMMDPNAANHVLHDPIMKNKVIMFPYSVTSKFCIEEHKFANLKDSIPHYLLKSGEQKHPLFPTSDDILNKVIVHGLPALICISEYIKEDSNAYDWGYKEHRLIFTTENPYKGKANILKVVENEDSACKLLDIDQRGSAVVYDMNYDEAWKTFCHLLNEADDTYTRISNNWYSKNIKLLSMLVLSLSLFLSFIYRVY